MRKAWGNGGELFQCLPGRSLRDGDVRVVRLICLADGGVDDADGESNGDERKEDRNLGFGERKGAVKAGDKGSGSGQRLPLAEDGIGGGDSGLGYDQAVVHVAEINDADLVAVARAVYEDVVVVRVAVDDALAQRGEKGHDLGLV